ncbi:MAG: NADH-quinone oxidoreductase subunit J [Anaerolineales bacterium]|nr:NADH-quinone oxidoreductase subunit J [Anaerolineales bacterium]
MTVELVIFLLLAATAILSAVMMLLSKNAVHSALWLVLNFAVVAFFFLWLGAPFIAMVQVTVYAGAIMVLFLFVIMLLGAELVQDERNVLRRQPWWAMLLAAVFLGVVGMFFLSNGVGPLPPAFADEAAARAFGSPTEIGLTLFTQYSLPFEVTSFLLLVGMIGAVVLTRDEKK